MARLRLLLLLALPGAALTLADVLARRALLARYTWEAAAEYVLYAGLSLLLWGALVAAAAAHRRGLARWVARGVLALAAFFAAGAQLHTFARYGTYLNWRVALMGSSLFSTIVEPAWPARLVSWAQHVAPVVVVLATFALVARRSPGRKDREGRERRQDREDRGACALDLALLAIAFALFDGSPTAGWDNGAPPDILYFSAVGALAHSKWTGADVMTAVGLLPGARSPLAVPALVPRPSAPRDVVFVLTESVRASDACSAFDPSCASTPFTNEALPRRFGFREMRSVDSTTALSLAVLWSGLSPTATREALHTAPLAWEYAHAAGIDTGYFTSQNLLFANAGRWLEGVPLSRFVSGTEIDPYATYQCGADDETLMTRALEGIATLRSPYFAVVHLSNTHFPYRAEDGYRKSSDDDAVETLARYRSSIRRQDRIVERFVEALRATPAGARTVVVFASDHGEQIYERGQEGHTWSLYEEEIRVPMWIDAPPGTLSSGEASTLRALESVPLTNLDVMPTLLDLLGVWDAPGVEGFRAKMPGASLLRGGTPPARPVVMSNCSALFACATKNWGAMRWPLKLIATQDEDDGAWRCFDVTEDPGETHDLGVAACGGLRALAEGEGRGQPR